MEIKPKMKCNFINRMNELGAKRIPFLAVIDFQMKDPEVLRLDEINPDEIAYYFNGKTNAELNNITQQVNLKIVNYPEYEIYHEQFQTIFNYMYNGDSWLINLTTKTEIQTTVSLLTVFNSAASLYKLFYKNRFVCFSPETFIKINENIIKTFPMKGTIKFENRNSLDQLMDNPKELAEHLTVVDLLRNDLSIVSKNVTVEKFRYPSLIKTDRSNIWQTSSEISGELEPDWHHRIGSIISKLLPAGSITGAPKRRCVEIINEVENHERGFYTGVAVLFDGFTIDSCVLIRFIESRDGKLFYKSGGGITIYSDPLEEYREMINKIYVPYQ